ncbi:MAG: proton extrusion protein PcxA [Cyanobacteria bacterium CRU_2_1]|nr:proton extrusion protein PcxA [Cyanobacteria bacterium RU_5_0]NJR63438.1 proton extrusion protein PcxA [Cyanobacteria bacterium CRU_2_1]
MSSHPPKRQLNPFARVKEQFLAPPEQLLEQAYQAALKIEFIEGKYFNGEKVFNNAQIEFPQAEFEQNLDTLERSMKGFNSSRSAPGKLGQDYLMKSIFAEGILAKYTIDQNTSALAPFSSPGITPGSANHKPHSLAVNIIDVRSVPSELLVAKRNNQTQKNHSSSQTRAESDNEKPGVLPRSIRKTIDKIKNDLDPEAEKEVVNNFRRSRAKTVIALRLLALLVIVPLLTQQISKNFLFLPIVGNFRGEEAPAFINTEMKEEALEELHIFEEELKLDSLISSAPPIAPEVIEEQVKHKAVEIEEEFRHKSNGAISNILADMLALVGFALVLLFRRSDIAVLKSFIDGLVSGLSDSAKAFAIILSTDMFVGFHSPHGWEVVLEGLANHLGVAANHSMISLFIATVPVVGDTAFKYWIFRSLSRMSPSTVATLKEMNE